jgi:hypothetical protein
MTVLSHGGDVFESSCHIEDAAVISRIAFCTPLRLEWPGLGGASMEICSRNSFLPS